MVSPRRDIVTLRLHILGDGCLKTPIISDYPFIYLSQRKDSESISIMVSKHFRLHTEDLFARH